MTTELQLKPAGFWRRLLANAIDWFIIWTLGSALGFVIAKPSKVSIDLIIIILGALYYIYFLSSPWQATLGKHLLNVYVVRADGVKAISKGRAFCRYLAFIFPFAIITLTLFFIHPVENTSKEERQQFKEIMQKSNNKESLSDEEKRFRTQYMVKTLYPDISIEDQKKANEIFTKQEAGQNLTVEEKEFQVANLRNLTPSFQPFYASATISVLYLLILVLTVDMTKEKKGIHDMLCKTRVVCGRPEKPMVA